MNKKKSKMRTWEVRDIKDIMLDHHRELSGASVELLEGGDLAGSDKLDDDCLVIEHYLEVEHGLEWNGEKFVKGENPYTVTKEIN